NESENIKLNNFQKIIAHLMFILFIVYLVFNLIEPKNIFIATKFEPIDYKAQGGVFVAECGSCHALYPTKAFP
ncbi:cytochrome B, partial [Aliarcobacter butzleri]